MNIFKNSLLKWEEAFCEETGENEVIVETVIHISLDDQKIVSINIAATTGFPVVRLRSELEEAYENADLRILEVNSHLVLQPPDDQIPEKHRKLRDEAWTLVEKVLNKAGDGIYYETVRGKAVAQVAEECKKSEKVIYAALRKYWKKGCTKNALLPEYFKCGAKGRRRLAEEDSAPKLGRPKSLTLLDGKSRGIRITPRIEKLFDKGLKKFYSIRESRPLHKAFNKTLHAYFNEDEVEVEDENGNFIPVMPPRAELPSFDQFKYWYDTYKKDFKRDMIARQGQNAFDLSARELTGDSTSLATGPGAVYMIDATIADVYLVSGFDRKRIIGRPIIYFIMDVFSRMIVGFSVSLFGPSWQGACLALDNMVSDKVEFCARLGHPLRPGEWNCQALPEAIFADRGEFEGYNANVLVSVFGIRIHNTAPRRGDLKGIVERAFGIANEKVIHYAPGTTVGRRHGEKPNALDASWTLSDFRYMLLTHILEHNAGAEMSTYRPEKCLIADNVPLVPSAIWNWGIENRSGLLRAMPRDLVRLNLLPRRTAVIQRQGIHLQRRIYYRRPPEIPLGTKHVEIAWDPENLDVIYIPAADGKSAIVAPLTAACSIYKGKSFYEVEDNLKVRKAINEPVDDERLQLGAASEALRDKRNAEAKKATAEAWAQVDDQSDRAKLGGMRNNRREERLLEREADLLNGMMEDIAPPQPLAEALAMLPDPLGDAEKEIADDSLIDDEQYVAKPSNKALLKKLAAEQREEND